MIELIAKHTIGRRKVVREADEKTGQKQKTAADNVSAGGKFEVETEEEAKELVRNGAARRMTEAEKAAHKLGGAPESRKDYEELTKDELVALAEERGLVLGKNVNTKAEIITALRKHG